jgi:hypothetical protein
MKKIGRQISGTLSLGDVVSSGDVYYSGRQMRRCQTVSKSSQGITLGVTIDSHGVIRGNGVSYHGSDFTFVGNDSVIAGSDITVYGSRNRVTGSDVTIYGHNNSITGSDCNIIGNNNKVTGSNLTIRGHGNQSTGMDITVSNVYVDLSMYPPPAFDSEPLDEGEPKKVGESDVDHQFLTTEFLVDEKSLDGTNLCVVCIDNKKQLAIQECGHLCLCFACAKQMMDAKDTEFRCPMCKVLIRQKLNRIFY